MNTAMIVKEIIKREYEVPDLHQKIRSARKDANLSISQIANKVGVTRQYWSQVENNRLDSISIDLLRNIEKILNTTLL